MDGTKIVNKKSVYIAETNDRATCLSVGLINRQFFLCFFLSILNKQKKKQISNY